MHFGQGVHASHIVPIQVRHHLRLEAHFYDLFRQGAGIMANIKAHSIRSKVRVESEKHSGFDA